MSSSMDQLFFFFGFFLICRFFFPFKVLLYMYLSGVLRTIVHSIETFEPIDIIAYDIWNNI